MIRIDVTTPVYSKIAVGDTEADSLKILMWYAEQMQIRVPNYQFHPAYKSKRWDGRLSFFNVGTGLILTGLVSKANEDISQYMEVQLNDPHGLLTPQKIEVDPNLFVDTPFGHRLYPDQVFAINNLIKHKRAVGCIATGAGKTVEVCAIMKTLQPEHGLVIVPNLNLVMQTYDEGFVDCGMGDETGMYYGSRKDEIKQFTVATWQSLAQNKDLMKGMDLVIIDECHGVKGREIQDLMIYAENATTRYGVTGTIPQDQCTQTTLQGVIGPTTVEVSSSDLQERGRLANCQIIIANFEYPKDFKDKINREARLLVAEAKAKNKEIPGLSRRYKIQELSKYKPRIAALKRLIEKTSGLSVVLNTYTDEGKLIEAELNDSAFMDGSTKMPIRKTIRDDITSGKVTTLVTSYKMGSTGLNFKTLKNVFLASPTKAYITVIQSIGRALRQSEGKGMAFIFDINDKVSGVESASTRLKYYEEKNFPVKEITLPLDDLFTFVGL